MISINLLNVFTQMNAWMIGKNSMKPPYLQKKILQSPKHGRYYKCRLHIHTKIVCKDFEVKNLDEYHDLYAIHFKAIHYC